MHTTWVCIIFFHILVEHMCNLLFCVDIFNCTVKNEKDHSRNVYCEISIILSCFNQNFCCSYFFCCIRKIQCSPVDGRRSTNALKRRYSLSKLNFIVYSSLNFGHCNLDDLKLVVSFFCLFCFAVYIFGWYLVLLQFLLFHN